MTSYEIPKYQKAIVATKIAEDCKVEVDDKYPIPEPGYGEILVRLTSSGVCHSDLSLLQDHWPIKLSVKVVGHEGSGYIVKHGPGVNQEKHPLGKKVAVALQTSPCHNCFSCTTLKAENFCSDTGYYGCNYDGTWMQYIIIKDSHVIPVPDGVDQSVVGPISCGGVTTYRALKEMSSRPGMWVVVAGAGGGLGCMAIQFCKAFGLRPIGIDTGDDKAETAKKLGCEYFVDFKKVDVVKTIMEITEGHGADGVLMLVPSAFSYNQAPQYMAVGSTMVTVGLPKEGDLLSISPMTIAARKLKIVGTYVGTKSDIVEALDFVKRGVVTPPVTVRKMQDCQEVLEQMRAGKVVGRIVFDLN